MRDNKDLAVIVLDRDIFDSLFSLAEIGSRECGDEHVITIIRRHSRKFNKSLRDERQAELATKREAWLNAKREISMFLKNNSGKIVYLKERTGIYMPVLVKGRTPKSQNYTVPTVRVQLLAQSDNMVINVSTRLLVSELPEGIEKVKDGSWKDYYASKEATISRVEELARRDNESRRNAYKAFEE